MVKNVLAPAKVNLCLHVLGRRADGYHDLAMLMVGLALYDRLEIRVEEGSDVSVTCPGFQLGAGESNIAEKAARLLLRHAGLERRVAIRIDKRIPVAAGLGGGSSDAAAVLAALDEMLGLGLSRAELMQLGLRLGADVPFFLFGRTAWATGVGEMLSPWPGLPDVTLLLVNPGIAVSTAEVFGNLRLTHQGATAKIPRFPEGMSGLVRLLHNDLEVVTCQRHPVITTIKERLVACGAAGALMSGSGPTVFGLFGTQADAERAAARLSQESGWWTAVAAPL